jgi:hypothetical protein
MQLIQAGNNGQKTIAATFLPRNTASNKVNQT